MTPLKFQDLFKYNCLVFMHKIWNNRAPPSFHNFFQYLAPPNRTKGFLILDKIKNDSLTYFPSYFLPRKWNDLPVKLKMIESHSSFKDSAHFSFISKYPPAYKCKDKSCPDCYPPVIYLSG